MYIPAWNNWIEALSNGADLDYIYVIETRKNDKKFFFFAVSPSDPTTVSRIFWTPKLLSAHGFTSEQTVEEFKSEHITPRKASIIRMPAVNALMALV